MVLERFNRQRQPDYTERNFAHLSREQQALNTAALQENAEHAGVGVFRCESGFRVSAVFNNTNRPDEIKPGVKILFMHQLWHTLHPKAALPNIHHDVYFVVSSNIPSPNSNVEI